MRTADKNNNRQPYQVTIIKRFVILYNKLKLVNTGVSCSTKMADSNLNQKKKLKKGR
jgi:hypothetical protein